MVAPRPGNQPNGGWICLKTKRLKKNCACCREWYRWRSLFRKRLITALNKEFDARLKRMSINHGSKLAVNILELMYQSIHQGPRKVLNAVVPVLEAYARAHDIRKIKVILPIQEGKRAAKHSVKKNAMKAKNKAAGQNVMKAIAKNAMKAIVKNAMKAKNKAAGQNAMKAKTKAKTMTKTKAKTKSKTMEGKAMKKAAKQFLKKNAMKAKKKAAEQFLKKNAMKAKKAAQQFVKKNAMKAKKVGKKAAKHVVKKP